MRGRVWPGGISILLLFVMIVKSMAVSIPVPCCEVSAIYAAAQDTLPNDIIQLAPGTYSGCLSNVLSLKSSISFRGNSTSISCPGIDGLIISAPTNSITIVNIKFESFPIARVLNFLEGSFLVENCTFYNNGNGAIFAQNSTSISVISSNFFSNPQNGSFEYYVSPANATAAIFNGGTFTAFFVETCVILGSSFVGNRLSLQGVVLTSIVVSNPGFAVGIYGGNVQLINSTISSNSGHFAVLLERAVDARVSGSTFTGNSGSKGAALQAYFSTTTIESSQFLQNQLVEYCHLEAYIHICTGAVDIEGGNVTVFDTYFAGNQGDLSSSLELSSEFANVQRTHFYNNTAENTVRAALYQALLFKDCLLLDNQISYFDIDVVEAANVIPPTLSDIHFDNVSIIGTYGVQSEGAMIIRYGPTPQQVFFTVTLSRLYLQSSYPGCGGLSLQGANFTLEDSTISSAGIGITVNFMYTSEVVVINSHINGNSAGGLSAVSGYVTLINSTFVNNLQSNNGLTPNGGAVSISQGCLGLIVEGCHFAQNSATYGGAVWVSGGASVSIVTSNFTQNICNQGGCGLSLIFIETVGHKTPQALIHGCVFEDNESLNGVGSIPGAAILSQTRDVIISQCQISRNNALSIVTVCNAKAHIVDSNFTGQICGSAFSSITSHVTILGTTFTGNTGLSGYASAIQLSHSNLFMSESQLTDNQFYYENSASLGTISVDTNSFARISSTVISRNQAIYGAGILTNGTLDLINVTISGNSLGGGLMIEGGVVNVDNTTTISENSGPSGGGGILLLGGTLMITSLENVINNVGSIGADFLCSGGTLETTAGMATFGNGVSNLIECGACGCCSFLPSGATAPVTAVGNIPFAAGSVFNAMCDEAEVAVTCVASFLNTSYLSYSQETPCFGGCGENCLACNGKHQEECLECDAGFAPNVTAACAPCPDGCTTCLSATHCTECDAGLGLVRVGAAVSCQACESPCAACVNKTSTCLGCVEGFAYEPTLHQCQACSGGCAACESCQACGGTGNCTACVSGYSLDGVECVLEPPSKRPPHWILYAAIGGGGMAVFMCVIVAVCVSRKRTGKRKEYRELPDLSEQGGQDTVFDSIYASRVVPKTEQYPTTQRQVGPTTIMSFGRTADTKFDLTLNNSEVGFVPFEELTIFEPLGQGGQGKVYHVQHNKTLTEMALKVLEGLDSQEGVAAALNEIKVLINLHHPHCLQYLGVCRMEGSLGILTEYMSAGDLQSRTSLTVHQKLRALAQAGKGLAYLHLQNFIHCDVKPSNIFLDDSGKAVLGDFGVAGALQPRGLTKAYASPEVLAGERVTQTSDIFSFAATSITVLVDEMPKQAVPGGAYAFASTVLARLRTRLRSDEVAVLLEQGLSVNPDARPKLVDMVSAMLKLASSTPFAAF